MESIQAYQDLPYWDTGIQRNGQLMWGDLSDQDSVPFLTALSFAA